MKKLKIGIMPREQFQRRLVAIAAGTIKPKPGEPKIWFSSIRSLSEVLSENNVKLLKIIKEEHPQTLAELARISGRQTSNISRTLKKMESHGIVELKRREHQVMPVVKATAFDIQYEAV